MSLFFSLFIILSDFLRLLVKRRNRTKKHAEFFPSAKKENRTERVILKKESFISKEETYMPLCLQHGTVLNTMPSFYMFQKIVIFTSGMSTNEVKCHAYCMKNKS